MVEEKRDSKPSGWKVYWYVKKRKTCVYFEHISEAIEDWKSHPGEWRVVLPVLMPRRVFEELVEFNGW